MADGLYIQGKHGIMQIDDNYLQLKIVAEGTVSKPKRDDYTQGGTDGTFKNATNADSVQMPLNYNNTIDYTVYSASAYDLTGRITIVTNSAHGLSTGDQIIIQGVIGNYNYASNPNGVHTVSAVQNANQFSIGAPGPQNEMQNFFKPSQPSSALVKTPGPSAPYDLEDVLIFARLAGDNNNPQGTIGIEFGNSETPNVSINNNLTDDRFWFTAPAADANWDTNDDLYIDYKIISYSPLAAEEISDTSGLFAFTEDGDIAYASSRTSFVGEDVLPFSSSIYFSNAQPQNNDTGYREEVDYRPLTQDLEGAKDYYILMNALGGEVAVHVNGQTGVGYEYREWRNFLRYTRDSSTGVDMKVTRQPFKEYGTKTDNNHSFGFNFNNSLRALIIGKFR